MKGEIAELREHLRRIAQELSPRIIAERSGVSHATVYRFIEAGSKLEPNRATLTKLQGFAKKWRINETVTVTDQVLESPAPAYVAGSSVAKFGTRAREIILQYLRRLEAAGLGAEELIQMEHLLTDRSYSQRFSMTRGGPLTEDEEILLLESTWRAISDTLALRGIRP